MEANKQNIFTFHGEVIQRPEKEKLLKQKAKTIWLTGLSGSGKTTIAILLERALHDEGFITMLLDGDNVRDGINNNLDFTEAGRTENIRRIAEVNKLFNNCGVVTINCFVSPMVAQREMARKIVGKNLFIEAFVNTPLEICEQRDVKGLYAKARKGEIPNFTGISAPFEAPLAADIVLNTAGVEPETSAQTLFSFIKPLITYP